MKQYVAGFLFDNDKQNVVLIRKNRPEYQAGKLNAVGGKFEPIDRTVFLSMEREFFEEAGVNVAGWDNFCVLRNEILSYEVYFFRTFNTTAFNAARTMESESIVKLRVKEAMVRPDTMPNLCWLIPMALDTSVRHAAVIDQGTH